MNKKSNKAEIRLRRGVIKTELDFWGVLYPLKAPYTFVKLLNEQKSHVINIINNKDGKKDESGFLEIRRTDISDLGHNVLLFKNGETKAFLDGREMLNCSPYALKRIHVVAIGNVKKKIYKIVISPDYQNNLPPTHFHCVHVFDDSVLIRKSLNHKTFRGFSLVSMTPCDVQTATASDKKSAKKIAKNLNKIIDLNLDSKLFIRMLRCSSLGDDIFISLPVTSQRTLMDLIFHQDYIPERSQRFICFQILLGLRYLHLRNICHGNLSPFSVAVMTYNADPIVCLKDVGLVVGSLEPNEGVVDSRLLSYQPPEVISTFTRKKKIVSKPEDDIWSAGVCVLETYMRMNPFEGQLNLLKDFESFLKLKISVVMSLSFFDFLDSALQRNPKKRNLKSLLTHRWLDSQKLEKFYEDLDERINLK